MTENHKTFIYVNKDITTQDFSLRQDEIGIIKSESEDSCLVFFVIIGKEISISRNDFDIFKPEKTGDGFPKKVCNLCHRLLPTEQFSKNQNGRNNRTIRRPSCNECRKTIDGVDVSSSEKQKWAKLKPEYEPFQCPICQKITIAGLTSKIVLDHDHSNGKVRGWICDSCNTGIGRFKDDVSILKKAISYLESS